MITDLIKGLKKSCGNAILGGSKIEDLVFNAKHNAKSNPHDVVFIVGRINDQTVKDRRTNQISFPWKDPVKLARHLIDTTENSEDDVHKDAPATRIVFCNLTGADLNKVLKKDAMVEQEILNEAIYLYNEEIFQRNVMKEQFAPDMASAVASPVHEHILLNCKKFENSRKNHLKNVTSMKNVFDNNECKTILNFLREVQLFEKI